MESTQRLALTPETTPMTSCGRGILQLAGRPAQDRRWRATVPEERRATNPRTGGRPGQAAVFFFFLHCRHLRVLPGLQRLRVRGRARPWYLCWGYLWVGLSSSYRPLPCPRPLTPFAGCSSEGGPSATSLCSLTQRREIHMLPRTLYFIPAVDPSSRAVRRTTTRCLWSQS